VTAAPGGICVVHLVRAANGMAPLRSFLDSYARHPAGMAHELLLLCKGFGQALPDEYEQLLQGVACVRRFIPDRGFDVDAYFSLARAHDAQAYCFLNSFSVILADGWLAKLHGALAANPAGIVGATGSWQSISYNYADSLLLSDARRAGFPLWKRVLLTLFPFLHWLLPSVRKYLLRNVYHPFPNYHLRTNAFMIRRERAMALSIPRMRRKSDAYRFESGVRGLTQQILATGGRVLVVGRDGIAYDMQDWPRSDTYWHRDQENLMVADNQTRMYDALRPEQRAMYSTFAWGPEANPAWDWDRAPGA
jgi:hypothetical protein